MKSLGVNVRFADNTETLKQHLREGLNSVDHFADGFRKYRDVAAQALADTVTRVGNLKGAVASAEAEVSRLQKAWQNANNETIRQGLSHQIGLATIGAKALKDELKETERQLMQTLSGSQPGWRQLETNTRGATSNLKQMQSAINSVAGAFGVAFTVQGLIRFGQTVIETGDHIQKMADQTDLSIEQVQKLEYIASQSGSSIQSLVGAVQTLQQRLGDENDGAVSAMRKLRINTEEFNKLNTYDQMLTLASAIKDIKDPTEQASTAAALFGRQWKEILPAIKAGMKDVGDQAPIMADATVKALADINDAGERAKRQSIVWAAGIIKSIEGIGFAAGNLAGIFNPEHLGLTNTAALARQIRLSDPTGLRRATGNAQGAAPTMVIGAPVPMMGLPQNLKEIERDLTSGAKSSPASRRAMTEAQRDIELLAKAYEDARLALIPLTTAQAVEAEQLLKLDLPLDTIARKIGAATVQVRLFRDGLKELAAVHKIEFGGDRPVGPLGGAFGLIKPDKDWLKTLASVQQVEGSNRPVGPLGGAFPLIKPNAKADLRGKLNPFFETFDAAAKQIPNILVNAMTGGGGLAGAAAATGSLFGSTFMAKAFGSSEAKTGLLKNMTGLFGSLASSAMPVIGALVGPLLGKLFGPSEESAKVNKPRETFVQSFGGLPGLNAQIMAATGSLQLVKNLLNAKTEKDYAKAVDAITAALGGMKQKMDDATASARSIKDRLENLTDISPDLQSALEKVYDAKNPDDYAAALKNVNDILDEQDRKANEVSAALQKYGLSWSDAGEEVRKAEIGKQAATFVKDFKALKAAGVDINVEMRAMGPSLNDFVKAAKKAGVEVPDSMKEVLQVAIDSGVLFDDNGKKIENLEQLGLKFGATQETAFKKVETAVEKLAKVLERLDRTLRGLPPEVETDVNVNYNTTGDQPGDPTRPGVVPAPVRQPNDGSETYAASTGGVVTALGVQRFAGGGKVLPFVPTQYRALGGFGGYAVMIPHGKDTVPVMATPEELFLNEGQQSRAAAIMAAGLEMSARLARAGDPNSGKTIILQEKFDIALHVTSLDPQSVADVVDKQLMPEFVKNIEDRRRDYATRLRRVMAG